MSHVLIAKLFESLGNALAEAVVTPEFVKTLNDTELCALHDLLRSEAFERNVKLNESNLLSSVVNTFTPEAQCAILREQFGDNGQKKLDQFVQGAKLEMLAPELDKVEHPFAMVRNELGHMVLNIADPIMNSNALLLMAEHFRNNGINDGYRLGDLYYFYVLNDQDLNSTVHFHNRTTQKIYALNAPLAAFSQWYRLSLETIDRRMNEFLAK
jgi:hypothetical protein